jgi:hypothetical protein
MFGLEQEKGSAVLLIYQIPLGAGMLVICPMPGRLGAYKAYLKHLVDWRPNLVLTMAPLAELQRPGASTFPYDLAQAGIQWLQRPIVDFGTPFDGDMPLWSAILQVAHRVLSEKCFVHPRSVSDKLANVKIPKNMYLANVAPQSFRQTSI